MSVIPAEAGIHMGPRVRGDDMLLPYLSSRLRGDDMLLPYLGSRLRGATCRYR